MVSELIQSNNECELMARMLVPKFVCEVFHSFGFAWPIGGDGDLSRKKCCKTSHSALSRPKKRI
jgi:hypothetical protein